MPTDERVVELLLRWEQLRQEGREAAPEALCDQCPELLDQVRAGVQDLLSWDPLLDDLEDACRTDGRNGYQLAPPSYPTAPLAVSSDTGEILSPKVIGRYRVDGVLGEGAYGRVYLAYDQQLERRIAIKVPHRKRFPTSKDARKYLGEARILASLDHPHIVPVHDVGETDDGLPFVVSKFIEGSDLAMRLRQNRLGFSESALLVAAVAEALHYAHEKKLVHRDVKPGNILLDSCDTPYLADFGLALKEDTFGTGAGIAGTPAYMSPEQANGESHLVDGRSDIFGLGVVLYELLTGRRPFVGTDDPSILEQIRTAEPVAPRRLDPAIPAELDRICTKALAKRASERYAKASDLASDLRHWVSQSDEAHRVETLSSPQEAVKVVPKGLRSFDASDADFFLELLPGPRDRDGLPETLRFWKSRIEEMDADKTFRVGLMYGPSGCGKSSLVKAGLLPRLGPRVAVVYVEANAEDTEARLLKALRHQCHPALASDMGLQATMTALRQRPGPDVSTKVLIVLDQFEQWLHARREEENSELAQALRQCDGKRLQCVVMIRDDFWMAATRFMHGLEIPFLEGENSAAVDLFSVRHAEKVLAAYGRAFGVLPQDPAATSETQNKFLREAVAGLAQDGRVACVRLALFAELMKARPWMPRSLSEVGGIEGLGATFLEETFSAPGALPVYRYHQNAAREVLKALLPPPGTDLKGHRRSHEELREASGYSEQRENFEQLLRILDSELRLLTPTDDGASAGPARIEQPRRRFYQLTHDYLVPSLRDWLNRKQRETRRGRAELRLEERAALWSVRQEKRFLPSAWEWATIALYTRRRDWTGPQREMMARARTHHLVRGIILVTILALLTIVGREGFGRLEAHRLRDRLLDAEIMNVQSVVEELGPYRTWITPLLRQDCADAGVNGDASRQLRASLGLLGIDPGQVDYLYGRFLTASPEEVGVLRDALSGFQGELQERLWAVAEQPSRSREGQQFRAACALAGYDPDSARWNGIGERVVTDLLGVPTTQLAAWMKCLRPVREKLLVPLTVVFRDDKRRETERSLAAAVLADYAADQAQVLADLLMDAGEKQFAPIFSQLQGHAAHGQAVLLAEMSKELSPDAPDALKEKAARRRTNAAVALLKMHEPAMVWPLLRYSPDPRARSYLIHRLAAYAVDAQVIVKRLENEPDLSARRALILSLGEFTTDQLPLTDRYSLVPKLASIYREDPDPGMHASVEWLLRRWDQPAKLREIEQDLAKTKDERLARIRKSLSSDRRSPAPQWYMTGQGETMVVIPRPGEFLMGSPKTEWGRNPDEDLHRVRIERTFAIASKTVTVEQFLRFRKDYDYQADYAPTSDCPVNRTSWFFATEYCNWLNQQEGIPRSEWCYEPNKAGKYEEGMRIVPDHLERTGYRLPTDGEWEYACRASTTTARYYGETEELLGKYAWHLTNSSGRTWPVGSLKPNDWGLFDMLGNVWTWCTGEEDDHSAATPGAKPAERKGDGQVVTNRTEGYPARGGAFDVRPGDVRAAHRNGGGAEGRDDNIGFRIARTIR